MNKNIFRLYVEFPGIAAIFTTAMSVYEGKAEDVTGEFFSAWFFFSCLILILVGGLKRFERWGWVMAITWAVVTLLFAVSSVILVELILFLSGFKALTTLVLALACATTIASILLANRHFLAKEEAGKKKVKEPVFFSFRNPIFNWDITSR